MFYNKIESELKRPSSIKLFDDCITQKENNTLFYGLSKSLKSLIIARALKKFQKNVVFITADDKIAEDYADDFNLLVGAEHSFFIPDYETLPYEKRSPHFSIRAERIKALSNIVSDQKAIYSLSLRSFLRKITPPNILRKNVIKLDKGSEYRLDVLISNLVGLGYNNEFQVAKVGDFAHRGGILDVYSVNFPYPVRLEFFGDEIQSMRYFNIQNQKSIGQEKGSLIILPSREFSLHDIETNDYYWEKVHTDGFYEGIESDVSKLLPETSTLIEYFARNDCLIFWDEYQFIESYLNEIHDETINLWKIAKEKDKAAGAILPADIFENNEFLTRINRTHLNYYLSLSYQEFGGINESYKILSYPQQNFYGDLKKLEEELSEKLKNSYRIFIQSDNDSQSKRMQDLLEDFAGKIVFVAGVLQNGFTLPDLKLSIYTDHEIFDRYRIKRVRQRFSRKDALTDYETLQAGDYIVHINHGVGIYGGLKKITIAGNTIECLAIHYSKNDKIYVPTYQVNLVTKFVSEDGIVPKIHSLGGKLWQNQKERAKKNIELIAEDLIELYAQRKLQMGISFSKDTEWQELLENSFIYEETDDQNRAIKEIKQDMESDIPMERLLCGDVGFGKTEVAIRAAFKAVMSGFQVVVLVPTTLLAEQHYLVFQERLAQYPVNIEMFSRFRTSAKLRQSVQKLALGEIDIAIGTHRLLSKDISFKRLGLFIIDEEHRFGVRHKDKLRKMRTNVDTLYMSATPIPRTMYMALSKLKEMSLIQTSPKARLPIRTVIVPFDEQVIKDGIMREINRGGQVFFVHNRVQSIESIAHDLRKMLPNVRFEIGHGQMPEKHLEKVMLDFSEHKFDVFIASTIIESGIDIPNANTIIINDSHRFGLAQLYQLRGRVGRSNRRAYAYFIIPPKLTFTARKRLETLIEYESLGSGYQIAMRDMELRGAGALLGTKQSGIIHSIGFNYYNRLLEKAVKNIQTNKANIWEEDKSTLEYVNIDIDYFFSKEYISDEKERLHIYKRMIGFSDEQEFIDLEKELIDRFGTIPTKAKNTINFFKIRKLAEGIGLKSFVLKGNNLIFEFDRSNLPSQKKISALISRYKYPVKFQTINYFKIIFSPETSRKEKLIEIALEIMVFLQNYEKNIQK